MGIEGDWEHSSFWGWKGNFSCRAKSVGDSVHGVALVDHNLGGWVVTGKDAFGVFGIAVGCHAIEEVFAVR